MSSGRTGLVADVRAALRAVADPSKGGEMQAYMELLAGSHNPATVENVMCTYLLSVRHDGSLFDCDFNAQIELPLAGRLSLFDVDTLADDRLLSRPINTGEHCYTCTAGAGSS